MIYLSKLDMLCIPDALSAMQLSSEATWNPQQDIPVPKSLEEKKEIKKGRKRWGGKVCSAVEKVKLIFIQRWKF